MRTYFPELCAMWNEVDEVHPVRYALYCPVVKVKYASFICCDNRGVIHNGTI